MGLIVSTVDIIFSNERRERIRLGADPCGDVIRAVHRYEAIGLRPIRLDAGDWVTLDDIGRRIGRSRESVRLWSVGRMGPGGFPAPLNPGLGTAFFSWAEVAAWLHAHRPDDMADVGEPVLAALNLTMQLRRLLPQLTRPDAVLALASPPVREQRQLFRPTRA